MKQVYNVHTVQIPDYTLVVGRSLDCNSTLTLSVICWLLASIVVTVAVSAG